LTGWVAGAGIGTAIVIMVMVSVAGPSRAVVTVPSAGGGLICPGLSGQRICG